MDSRPPPKPLRRGPKAVVRKSKEEREALERQTQQERRDRQDAAEADAAATERKRLQKYGIDNRPPKSGQNANTRGVTYRQGRGGRGGFMGSAQFASRGGGRPRPQMRFGGSGQTSGGGRQEAGPSTARMLGTSSVNNSGDSSGGPRIKSEDGYEYGGSSIDRPSNNEPMYISISDEEDAVLGRDVDHIIEISSDEDADYGRRTRLSFVPHRLQRQEHHDRATTINDEASAVVAGSHGDGPQIKSETTPKKKGKGRVAIKPDPEAMDMDLDAIPETAQPEDQPQDGEVTIPADHDIAAAGAPEAPMRNVPKATHEESSEEEDSKEAVNAQIRRKWAPRRPTFSTPEERQEYERTQRAFKNVAREFGQVTISSGEDSDAAAKGAPEAQMTAPDEDEEAQTQRPTAAGSLDNATYLFQFPPILPDLHMPRVKPDPGAESQTNDDNAEKKDALPELPDPPTAGAARKPYIEPGKVGKLRVHASGKMTLDWGGTSLSAGEGTSMGFLQSVMMMKLDDGEVVGDLQAGVKQEGGEKGKVKKEDKGKEREWNGSVTSFGQVRGKIVVTPDWQEILG